VHPDEFFDGVSQAEIDLDGDLVKLPIFYRDGEAITGVFPARLGALRKVLPDRRLKPARVAPGVGAVTITCFEYRESDVGVYNELAVGIILTGSEGGLNLPMHKLMDGVLGGQMHAYIHHLPVTTDLALRSGRQLWNFPKTVNPIDFEEDARSRTCHLSEGDTPILSLRVPKLIGDRSEQIQLFTHVYQDGQIQSGEFKLWASGSGRTLQPGAATLTLGSNHPIAQELNEVLISTKSMAASYIPSIIGILYGPDRISANMIQLAAKLQAARKVPRKKVPPEAVADKTPVAA
jgi:hypothetical protein